jgi:hypothetical protein
VIAATVQIHGFLRTILYTDMISVCQGRLRSLAFCFSPAPDKGCFPRSVKDFTITAYTFSHLLYVLHRTRPQEAELYSGASPYTAQPALKDDQSYSS